MSRRGNEAVFPGITHCPMQGAGKLERCHHNIARLHISYNIRPLLQSSSPPMNREAISSCLVQSRQRSNFQGFTIPHKMDICEPFMSHLPIPSSQSSNIVSQQAARSYGASLRLEPSQVLYASKIRAHAIQADGPGAANEKTNGHNKDSLSLACSKANSGKSDVVTMTHSHFDAIVNEKAGLY